MQQEITKDRLFRYFRGEASRAEVAMIDLWLGEDAAHRRQYKAARAEFEMLMMYGDSAVVKDGAYGKAYLMQTLKHRCLNEIRKDTVRQTTFRNLYDTDIDRLSDDNISRRILEKDIYAILADAGLKMEKLTYDIYVSSRIGGLSHKEIAKLYGLTTGRVAKEIMKATGIMDSVLKKYFLILMLLAMLYNR